MERVLILDSNSILNRAFMLFHFLAVLKEYILMEYLDI